MYHLRGEACEELIWSRMGLVNIYIRLFLNAHYAGKLVSEGSKS